jgi:LacI family transcriptional regulator
LRGSDLVRPQTRDRVLAVIEEAGFVPDGSAQGLSRRRKDIIGLVALERGLDEIDIEETGVLFVDQIVHAVEAVLRGTECSLLLSFGRSGMQFQQRIRALSGKVDGLLVVEEAMPPAQLRALATHVPVVQIAGGRAGASTVDADLDGVDLDGVAVDNAGGMRALALHLTQVHEYRRPCFVAGPPDAPDAAERAAAFTETTGSTDTEVLTGGDFSEGSGCEAARLLLQRQSLPEVVACANDQMAFGVLREFQRVGVRVPADVAVTGFDDIYPSRVIDPPLTTVSQPLRNLGSRAAERLLARIDDKPVGTRVEVLPTQLVIRASCGCGNE